MLGSIVGLLRSIITCCFDNFILLFVRRRQQQKVLLLIRLDAIGDFILWQNAAAAYRTLYPNHRIVLIANRVWSALAVNQPYWDDVWDLDRDRFTKDFLYRWQVMHRIRSAGIDTVIQPTYSREFLFGDAIVRISGANTRIGFIGDLSNAKRWQKRLSDRWYTRLVKSGSTPIMELKRNAEFVRGLGLKTFHSDIQKFELKDTNILISIPKEPHFIIFPGASWKGRQWPLERFAEVAKFIHRHTNWFGLICGGSQDKPLGNKLHSLCGGQLEDWTGKTTLPELVLLISNSKMVIGNETGAIHIAAVTGTPAICLLGGGHYGRFVPYDTDATPTLPLPLATIRKMNCFGCNWVCKYKFKDGQPVPCIEGISTESVKRNVDIMISQIAKRAVR